jgi:undecaprenyl-diphosphatase
MFQIPHTIFFDFFFSFMSLRGYSFFIWLIIIAVLILVEEKRDNKHHFIFYFVISFVLTALLVSFPLKSFFHTPRPSIDGVTPFTVCPTDYSFPSGHAATAFAAAYILSFYDKKRRAFYYAVAVLIAYSRIYLHCHYLIDVVGGAVIGVIISRLVLMLPGKRVGLFQFPR